MSSNENGSGGSMLDNLLSKISGNGEGDDGGKSIKKALPLLIGGILIIIIIAAIMFGGGTSCGGSTPASATTGFDPYCVLSVSTVGYDGSGSVKAEVDPLLAKYVIQNVGLSTAYTPQQKATYERLVNSLSYEVTTSTNGNLKNGNSVEIIPHYSKEYAEKLGIAGNDSPFVYKVSGLGDGKAYNPFNNLVVKFSGAEGSGEISFDTTLCDQFVKDNVKFTADMSGKNNGDTVMVFADYKTDVEVKDVLLSVTEHEYAISGLNHYAEKLDGVDMSDINRCLTDFAAQRVNSQEFQNIDSAGYKFTHNITYDTVGTYYCTDSAHMNAHYIAILKFTRTSTCIVAPEGASDGDTKVGDIKETSAYVAVTFRYVTITPDNKADFHDYTTDQSYTEASADQNFKVVYNSTVDMYATVQGFKTQELTAASK